MPNRKLNPGLRRLLLAAALAGGPPSGCGVLDFGSVDTGKARDAGMRIYDAGMYDDGGLLLPDGRVVGGDYGDGGILDGGVLPDGRVLGGGHGDGGILDGGVLLPDGRVVGGDYGDGGSGEPELDLASCSVADAEAFDLQVPFVEGGFALAPGVLEYGLAYRREGDCSDVLDTALVASGAGTPEPHSIIDECRTIGDLALGKNQGGWLLAWTDNSANKIELFSLALDAALRPQEGALRVRRTDNGAFERRPTLAQISGAPMLAWYEERASARAILTQRLEGAAAPQEIAPESAGRQPIELALAQMGEDHAALAWVEEVANRGVWLQPLDDQGRAVGPALQMTDFAAPGSSVDLATREEDGGGAVYSVGIDQVNFEVRYRRLDGQGMFHGGEVKLIGRPLQAKDAGIARLGGGFVVAYRAIPDGLSVTQPQVRIVFLSRDGFVPKDKQGRTITYAVADAALDGSPIQVEVSTDGQIMLAFVDGDDQGGNDLRLVRRRLDCGF